MNKFLSSVFVSISLSLSPVISINFPGVSDSAASRLIFGRQTFTTASCTADGVALNTIILNIGEGRVFQSPNYPSNYPNLQECTYNFETGTGAQLKFSCSDMDLTATSNPGDLCTGDYLRSVSCENVDVETVILHSRFYDENGQLGQSGERYCFSNKPDFTYTTNIKVLFKTNNDANTGKGRKQMGVNHRLFEYIIHSKLFRI